MLPDRRSIPLSALRITLDEGSAQAHWSVDPEGVLGRGLVQSANSVVRIPLRLGSSVGFTARVRLLPRDWQDRVGEVRAWIAVTGAETTERTLWSGSLSTAASRKSNPVGLRVDCELPPSATTLLLGLERRTSVTERSIDRAVWLGAQIADPVGLRSPLPPSGARPAPPRNGEARSGRPLVTILTPVHDPPIHMLEEAIQSVRSQTFANWQLCLVDDGSTNPAVIETLRRHAEEDPGRIRVKRLETAGGISTATNTALELATGEYIALLDHDDTLSPDALELVAEQLAAQPDLDMIYSDEDIVLDGRPVWLHLKPGWSPDTLRTNGYTCHLGVYRKALVVQIGGFRSEFDGSQDVDMILRLVERTDRIAHIPRILYHWRVHASSTAGGDAKPYAYVAARNAIAAHLERSGIQADVGYGPPGLYRVAHRVDPQQSIALVLAVEDAQGLEEAAGSWISQPHPSWKVVLAAPERALAGCADALRAAGVAERRLTMIAAGTEWSFAAALASAASRAEAEHLLLLRTPAAGLTYDWLTRLLGYSDQPQIAAAGPVVVGPDGRVSEAGIALPAGFPLYLLHGDRSSMDNFFGYGTSVYNVSAVSSILATRRDTYQQLGGLDPGFGELAMIEYCLRATNTGHRIVIVPDARLRATGPDVTVNDLPAIWRLQQSWARTHTHDPYYNPNYRTDRGDFEPVRS